MTRHCPHCSGNGRLSQRERGAAVASPIVFTRPLSLRLQQLKGVHQEPCRAFTRSTENVPKSTWSEEWNEWFQHIMALCVGAEGRFSEKYDFVVVVVVVVLLLLFFCFLVPRVQSVRVSGNFWSILSNNRINKNKQTN